MDCPICNKSGLPDITLSPTVCPQCNSDLSVFCIIGKISKQSTSFTKSRNILLGLLIASIAILFIYILIFKSSPSSNSNQNARFDSVGYYKQLFIKQQKLRILDSAKFSQIKYKIKKGDNLSKIAYLFYNDWSMYKAIQKDNNLIGTTRLMVGDSLIIKTYRLLW